MQVSNEEFSNLPFEIKRGLDCKNPVGEDQCCCYSWEHTPPREIMTCKTHLLAIQPGKLTGNSLGVVVYLSLEVPTNLTFHKLQFSTEILNDLANARFSRMKNSLDFVAIYGETSTASGTTTHANNARTQELIMQATAQAEHDQEEEAAGEIHYAQEQDYIAYMDDLHSREEYYEIPPDGIPPDNYEEKP